MATTAFTQEQVKELYPQFLDLYASLPQTLPADEIKKANSKKSDIFRDRVYTFEGREFVIPTCVFQPGGTSENIFRKIIQGDIATRGASVAVMGCGAGIESVLIAEKQAKDIYCFDIHAESITATKKNFQKYIGDTSSLHLCTSDLFSAIDGKSLSFDVILFNPPAVSVPISDDPDIVRNTCVGTSILTRFFGQIKQYDLLAAHGEIVITISNTSELQLIVSHAISLGFSPRVIEKITYGRPYEHIETFILGFC